MQTRACFYEHDLRTVHLTARERDTLNRAVAILQELRERLEDGRQDADEDVIVDVALAVHTCRDLAAEGKVPIV